MVSGARDRRENGMTKSTQEVMLAEPKDAAGQETIAQLMRKILERIGEDPEREGLKGTPARYEKAMRFLTSGYAQDPAKILNGAMFSVCYDEMVVVKDI